MTSEVMETPPPLSSELEQNTLQASKDPENWKGRWLQTDAARQIVIIFSIAFCLAAIVLVFLWLREPEMRPLGQYDTPDLIPILDHLDQKQISYQLQGNVILVKKNEFSAIRLGLTRAGLQAAAQEGDDIILNDMGFGTSQRLEQARLKLSRERQLARAIEQFDRVKRAKVLLATPKQSVFVQHRQPPSATVFLTLGANSILLPTEINAIVDMVATAVPGLSTHKVTVTDQLGRLLNSGTDDPTLALQRKEYQMEVGQEQRLKEKIQTILLPVLGMGKFTSEVDVAMDFSWSEETSTTFDPNNQAVRSESSQENYQSSQRIGGVPGALSNQPPVDSAIPEDIKSLQTGEASAHSPRQHQKQVQRNFEVDTKVRRFRGQTGVIARQTVSVAIDAALWKDISETDRQQQLENIQRLLMGGIGFDATRGDVINVVTMPFAQSEALPANASAFWTHPNFSMWLRWLVSGMVILSVVWFLLRPALMKLLYPNADLSVEVADLSGIGEEAPNANALEDDTLLLSDSPTLNLPNLNQEDDHWKAVRALVSKEPELAVQVIKHWISEDEDG